MKICHEKNYHQCETVSHTIFTIKNSWNESNIQKMPHGENETRRQKDNLSKFDFSIENVTLYITINHFINNFHWPISTNFYAFFETRQKTKTRKIYVKFKCKFETQFDVKNVTWKFWIHQNWNTFKENFKLFNWTSIKCTNCSIFDI